MAGRRGKRGHAVEHENEERWLLTYADMLTLMFALFMVLYSISSVNISKYQSLQESLKAAFSGSILSGGKAIMQSGSESTKAHTPATAEVPAIVPLTPNIPKPSDTSAQQISKAMLAASGAQQEQQSFKKLQHELNAYAKSHGFGNEVQTVIARQGLVVHVLTDKLLFKPLRREHEFTILMVSLGYLVSAWAGNVRDEHQLLGQVISVLASTKGSSTTAGRTCPVTVPR